MYVQILSKRVQVVVTSWAVRIHRMTHSSTGPCCAASTPLARAESVGGVVSGAV